MSATIAAGILLGWACIFLGLIPFFGLVWVRRRSQFEFLLFSLFSFGSAFHAAGGALFLLTITTPQWLQGCQRAIFLQVGSAILITPLLVHSGIWIAKLPWKRVIRGAYGIAIFYFLTLLSGIWWSKPPEQQSTTSLWLDQIPTIRSYPTLLALSFYTIAVGVTLFLNILLGWRLWKQDSSLRTAFAASSILSVIILFEAITGFTSNATGISLVPLGYMIFAFGVSLTLVARYTQTSEELEQQSQKLSDSYEAIKQAQGELIKREQLAVVGELAAIVAHEVRNPLAIITNAVASLRRKDASEEDRETLLTILGEESAHLNQLVGDLLNYARPLSPRKQQAPLCDFIEQSVRRKLTSYPGIDTHFEIQPSTNNIDFDVDLMRQVVDNLVENAIQAMREEGVLQIRISYNEQGACIELQDDGEGMDTQIRSQASTPFFTTRSSGTGLGLAIVTRVIEAHGGRVEFESKPDIGTTVRLFLPS